MPLNRPADGAISAAVTLPEAARGPSSDWEIIVGKMQCLGVSKFTLEGETGGRVVFSCLIPVAGRQAIAQRFEAEGSDMNHAAQATLRRITLWRATQTVTPQEIPAKD